MNLIERDRLRRSFVAMRGKLESRSFDPNATATYDLLADALYWPDEVRELGAWQIWKLRSLLHHRTGLIVGQLWPDYLVPWALGKEAFPNWIGFRPERCTYSALLADFFEQARKHANESVIRSIEHSEN